MEKGSSDYWNVLHTIRNNGSFKNYLLKGSLGNPKWFFCKNCFLEPIFLRVYLMILTCFKTTTIKLLFSTSRERSVLSSFHQTFPLQTDTARVFYVGTILALLSFPWVFSEDSSPPELLPHGSGWVNISGRLSLPSHLSTHASPAPIHYFHQRVYAVL